MPIRKIKLKRENKVKRAFVIVLLLLSFVFVLISLVVGRVAGAQTVFTAQREGIGGNDMKLKANWTKGIIVVVPEEIETYKVPPERVLIPVFVVSESGKARLNHIKLDFYGPNRSASKKVVLDQTLEPTGKSLVDILKTLRGKDKKAVKDLLKKGAYVELEIDVSALKLEEGATGKINVGVETTVDGQREAVQTAVQADYQASAFPNASGWYGGDGHVPTSWSPDVIFIPLANRVKYAKDNGFGFIIITDLEDGIGNKWPQYVA